MGRSVGEGLRPRHSPRSSPRWWQMERVQKHKFVQSETTVPKSPFLSLPLSVGRKSPDSFPSKDLSPCSQPQMPVAPTCLPGASPPPSSPSSQPWPGCSSVPHHGRSLINSGLFNNPSISMKQAVLFSLFLTLTFVSLLSILLSFKFLCLQPS